MVMQIPWLEEVITALKQLGGRGTLSDIYITVKERDQINLSIYTDWKAQIRRHIYLNSSDTDIFKGFSGNEGDIFYFIEGKGIWGLRDFVPSGYNVELTEDDTGFVEGKKMLRQHIYKERNPKVIRLAKDKFKKEHNGRLFCEICKFDFFKIYGEIGEEFIEGQHTIPVSEYKEGQITRVEDIAIVCSNCHRMLHRRRPWLTKEKLQELIREVNPNGSH
ncbi:HNH endonuclease [Niallia sp. BSM11]|uniref:HNH endonuclease n=1 Tax=Niallia sp. BSM11 TaxID=3391576 RepID=UPI0039847979